MIPLYGFLEGDTMGLLILADEADTIAFLMQKLMASAIVRRKPPANARLVHKGQTVDPELTVTAAHMQALDRFDVVEGDAR
jgi:Toluene-4-monooxygenase system protein B (TmoB)